MRYAQRQIMLFILIPFIVKKSFSFMIPYGDNEPLKYLLLTLICSEQTPRFTAVITVTRTIC